MAWTLLSIHKTGETKYGVATCKRDGQLIGKLPTRWQQTFHSRELLGRVYIEWSRIDRFAMANGVTVSSGCGEGDMWQ